MAHASIAGVTITGFRLASYFAFGRADRNTLFLIMAGISTSRGEWYPVGPIPSKHFVNNEVRKKCVPVSFIMPSTAIGSVVVLCD